MTGVLPPSGVGNRMSGATAGGGQMTPVRLREAGIHVRRDTA